ncbi:hypothetical protein MHU86_9975 [Fragilaria crotonensis]|nr:hypothetical protein MHU86_9975 [Fragilaria crotonensis]
MAVPASMPTMIGSAGFTIRTLAQSPTAPITPTAPTTLAPGTVISLPPFLASLPTPQGGYSVCHVCSEGYFVKDKSASVLFNGLTFQCSTFEAAGLQRLIPDAFCTDSLTNAVVEADEIVLSALLCQGQVGECIVQWLDVSVQYFEAAGLQRLIPDAFCTDSLTNAVVEACGCDEIVLSAVQQFEPQLKVPTAPITPTAPTTLAPGTVISLPPFLASLPTPQGGNSVCHVCSEGYFVKDKAASVSFNGLTFQCSTFEAAGLQRLIPDAFCTDSLTNAVVEACGCDEIVLSASPSSSGVNPPPSPAAPIVPTAPITPTAPTTLAPGTVISLPPFLASLPTPQGGNSVCHVCSEGYFVKDKVGEFVEACGCDEIVLSASPSSSGVNPPPSPAAPIVPTAPITPTAPTTLAPGTVISLPPFLASLPTPQGGNSVCHVCSEGYFVKDKSASVLFNGLTFQCSTFEAAGLQRLIPDAFCTDSLTNAVVEACGCDEIVLSESPSSTSQALTTAPSSVESPTPSEAPRSMSQVPTKAPTKSAGFTMSGIVTGSLLSTACSFLLLVLL